MDQSFSIGGGSGSGKINLTFSANGSNYALNYLDTMVGAIDTLLGDGANTDPLAPSSYTAFSPALSFGPQALDGTPIYQLTPGTVQGGTQNFDISTAGYAIDTVDGSVVINGDSAGGDSILVVGTDPTTTVNSFGIGNLVIFVDGNNLFNGSTGGGDETILGGSGRDTINTGTGSSTVNAGTGNGVIVLNDTGAGAFNDAVYLDTGQAQVFADGTGDLVVATAAGQTVSGAVGPVGADSELTVLLLPDSDGLANGYDVINGGSADATIFDESSANTVNGGDGTLTFVAASNISATIGVGNGTEILFGAAGDNITVGTELGGDDMAATGEAIFAAGAGNETLNGAAATGDLILFGAAPAAGVPADVLIGGSGSDTLVAGSGAETLLGGSGADTFLIDIYAAENATLTISDFGGSDTLEFGHYSAADVANALEAGQEVDGNFVVTLPESSTTVTFTGVTGAGNLDGHIVTF
jgi:hypothetical protein